MNSKDILAKLMATENITVEYNQSVNTAMFNTESRTLILPILESITPEVTDLFLGHEVGHALFTPMGQWDKIAKLGSEFRNIVNIVEDVRIEKMIQAKFAGLRKIFVKGYNNLLEKNFFGTEGREYSDYNLLDRLNLHFKLGTLAQVPFAAEEIEWRDKVDSCSSWEDVLSISEDLLNFLKSNQDEQEDNKVDEDGEVGNMDAGDMESDDSLDQDDTNNNGNMSEDSNSSDGDDAAGESDKETEENQERMTNNVAGGGTAAGEDDNEIVSYTQEAFDKQINNNIITDKDRSVINVYMDNLHVDDHMVSLEEFHSVYETYIADNYSNSLAMYEDAKSNIAMIHNEQKSLVSYLHKEFEMRKSADEYKRTRVAKTGVLNPNKLHAYKFSEDIFLRSNVVADGKSHGFIMFLDWSSSMSGRIHSTIEQLMMMCAFCKKANIPFEVYTFTATEKKHLLDANDKKATFYNSDMPTNEDISLEKRFRFQTKFSLVNIFNSASKINFNRQMMFLELLRSPYANHYNYDKRSLLYNGPANWGLKNTPLRSALVCATDLIKRFRKKNGTQIVNLCCLSDGAPNDSLYYQQIHPLSGRKCWDTFTDGYRDVNIIDRENGYTDMVTARDIFNSLSPYIKRIKSIPNVNVINYFLVNPKSTVIYMEFRYLADDTIPVEARVSPWALKDYCKVIAKNIKNNGFHSQPKLQGFDEFYLLPDRYARDDEDGLSFDDNMTKAKKVSAFIKNRKGRMVNKKMLSHFAEVVSK